MGCGASTEGPGNILPSDGGSGAQGSGVQVKVGPRATVVKQKRVAVAAQALMTELEADVTEKSPEVKQLILEAIENNMLFQGLAAEVIEAVIGTMKDIHVEEGENIITQGDPIADKFFVVQSGNIVVSQKTSGDAAPTELGRYGDGYAFGELALLYSCPRTATVTAAGPVHLWYLKQTIFQTLKRKYQEKMATLRLDLVGSVPLFAKFDEQLKQRLADALVFEHLMPGAVLFSEGEVGHKLFLLHKGRVVQGAGEELPEGSSCGEEALADTPHLHTTTVAVAADAAHGADVYSLTRTDFLELLGTLEDAWRWDFFRKVPILQWLTPQQVEGLVQRVVVVAYRQGDYVFRVGTPASELFVVQEGELSVLDDENSIASNEEDKNKKERMASQLAGTSTGVEAGELCRLQPGMCFGELALLYNDIRTASVRVVSPGGCRLFKLERAAFEGQVGAFSEIHLGWRMQMLRKIHFFQALSNDKRKRLSEIMYPRNYNPGDIITGGENDSGYVQIVESGRLSATQAGKKPKRLTSGDVFGTLSNNKKMDVTCDTQSVVLSLTRGEVESVVGSVSVLMSRSQKHGGAARMDIPTGSFELQSMDDLGVLKVLGMGAFGKVLLCKTLREQQDVTAGATVAVKCISKQQVLQSNLVECIVSERQVMMELDHPLLVKLYGTFRNSSYLFFILEVVMGGELFSYMQQRKNPALPEQQSVFYAACVSVCLEYLQDNDIVYRDIKPENLLIDPQGYLKMTDFGFAKKLGIGGKTYTVCGTPDYMAPELVKGEGHNTAVDWWSLGVLVYEFNVGLPPFFKARDDMERMRMICKCKYQCPEDFFSEHCRDLVKRLLVRSPLKRLGKSRGGCTELKKHPWFAEIDWDRLYQRALVPPYVPSMGDPLDTSNFEDIPLDAPHPGSVYDRNRLPSNGAFNEF